MALVGRLFIVAVSALTVYQVIADVTEEHLPLTYEGLECPLEKYQIEFSSNCTDSCPASAPFTFESMCLQFCPYGYLGNSSCVNSTQICHADAVCPAGSPYCYEYHCLTECPNGTIAKDGHCTQNCSDGSPSVSCVAHQCPTDRPSNEYGRCVKICSKGYILHDQKCVKACPEDLFQYNESCYNSCPNDASLALNIWSRKLCVNSCPDNTYRNGSTCDIHCPSKDNILWNGTCISGCPKSAPFVRVLTRRIPPYNISVCLPKCPDGSFEEGYKCVSMCNKTNYELNSTCLSECPDTHRYIQGTTPPIKCVERCDIGQLKHGNQCGYKCPSGLYILNETCVDNCPSSYIYKYQETCLKSCPSNLLSFNSSCHESCPSNVTYVFDGHCNTACPISHPNHVATGRNNQSQCVAVCPREMLKWGDKCLYVCPENTAVFNSTCVNQCPSSHQLKYQNETSWHTQTHCVDKCPENTYILNNTCFDNCPLPYVSFEYNHTCLENCPESKNSRFRFTSPGKIAYFRCTPNCSIPNYIVGDTCLSECPQSKPFAVGQTCLKSCPADSELITPFGGRFTCSKACPDPYIQENKTCVSRCSASKVIINKSCVDVKYCVNDYQYIEYSPHGTICRTHCLASQFIDVIQCVASCRYYSVGHQCVHICPDTHKYTLWNGTSNATKRCMDKCPDNLFTNGSMCVDACPFKYVQHDRSCVQDCPRSYPYLLEADVCVDICGYGQVASKEDKCISEKTCIAEVGFFIYDERCIDECPEYMFADFIGHGCIKAVTIYIIIVCIILVAAALCTYASISLCYYKNGKKCLSYGPKNKNQQSGNIPLLLEEELPDQYSLTDIHVTDDSHDEEDRYCDVDGDSCEVFRIVEGHRPGDINV